MVWKRRPAGGIGRTWHDRPGNRGRHQPERRADSAPRSRRRCDRAHLSGVADGTRWARNGARCPTYPSRSPR